jgi:16S rRNA (guanine527-N7)-methyltransferase
MFGPKDFATAANVSRETLERLTLYVEMLTDWNTRLNLVSKASLEDVWLRHVWDSAQLVPLIPVGVKTLVDLGSGAGFPGLVLALMLERKVAVTLFEATGKKCDFLRAVSQQLALNVDIRNARMEQVQPKPFDVVTARACAPLAKLLGYAQHFTKKNTVCLFLKGQSAEAELTEAQKFWRMNLVKHPSQTHAESVILEISQLKIVNA